MTCDNSSESGNCISSASCFQNKTNCNCIPCNKNNISITNTELKLLPLLSNKLFSCYKYSNSVNTLGVNAPFQLVLNPNYNYPNGGAICIENISYSYNSIGTTGSFQFFLNGDFKNFYPVNQLSFPCTIDILGIVGQAEVDAAIDSANETKAILDTITPNLSITEQENLLAQAAKSSAETNVLAAKAITTIANYFYPENTRTNLQNALILVAEGLTAHAQAEQVVANLLPNPTSDEITEAADNEKEYIDQSNTLIEQAASIILNYEPTPSTTILNYATSAISYAEQSSTAMNSAVDNPPVTFPELIVPLIRGADALDSLIDALGLLGETTEGVNFVTLLESMALQTVAMFNAHLGIEAAYDASQQPTDASAQNYINLAINYFLQSSNLIIESFNFSNTLQSISIYDVFESQNIKKNCCNSSDTSLFFQIAPAISVCNLQITLTGTIGGCPFTATYNNPNDFPLSLVGYTPQNFGFYICTPCSQNFKLIETMNNTFSINCVIPNGTYDSSSPNTLVVSTFSTVTQNIELSVITKTPLPVLANDSLVCEQTVDTFEQNPCD